jgi:hypothetical protein
MAAFEQLLRWVSQSPLFRRRELGAWLAWRLCYLLTLAQCIAGHAVAACLGASMPFWSHILTLALCVGILSVPHVSDRIRQAASFLLLAGGMAVLVCGAIVAYHAACGGQSGKVVHRLTAACAVL